MARNYGGFAQYHQATDIATVMGQSKQAQSSPSRWPPIWNWGYWTYSYNFENFFHPYVGALIKQLNQTDVPGMLNSKFLGGLSNPYTAKDYTAQPDPRFLADRHPRTARHRDHLRWSLCRVQLGIALPPAGLRRSPSEQQPALR